MSEQDRSTIEAYARQLAMESTMSYDEALAAILTLAEPAEPTP